MWLWKTRKEMPQLCELWLILSCSIYSISGISWYLYLILVGNLFRFFSKMGGGVESGPLFKTRPKAHPVCHGGADSEDSSSDLGWILAWEFGPTQSTQSQDAHWGLVHFETVERETARFHHKDSKGFSDRSGYAMLCQLCNAMRCSAMLCNAMQYYAMLCDGSGLDSWESWNTQAIGKQVVQFVSKWACPDMFAYILLLLLGWQSSLISLACFKVSLCILDISSQKDEEW